MSKFFYFKEFSVCQDKAAMKVGTDGVLLGAWCAVTPPINTLLDIGSGTGLLSLMLAQRTNDMSIDAVEVDDQAYEQTVENFERSSWRERLFCYHSSFQDLSEFRFKKGTRYDGILSNPPFYTNSFQTADPAKNCARFTSSLSFYELISGAAKILSKTGRFSVIIPFKEMQKFVLMAREVHLFPGRICYVKGTIHSNVKRVLLEFSFKKKATISQTLTIETVRHQYTKASIELVRDFYFKM